jgi:hypothetical protein
VLRPPAPTTISRICELVNVEEDGVAGWPRGALEHDQVPDAGQVREPVEQSPGETRRGDDADVQH